MANLPRRTKEEYIAFIKELAALTRRTGIAIGGCGCCGSPYLHTFEKGYGYTYNDFVEDGYMDNVKWVDEDPSEYPDLIDEDTRSKPE